MKSNLIGNLFLKLFTLSPGLLLLLPCAYKFYTYCNFRYHAVGVKGYVEKSMQGHDIGGRPWVAYKDTRGDRHEIRSKTKTNWFFAPKKGDEIKVLINTEG